MTENYEFISAADLPVTEAEEVDVLCVENGELKKKKEKGIPDNVLTYDKENPPAGVENGVFVGTGAGGGDLWVRVVFDTTDGKKTCSHSYEELVEIIESGKMVFAYPSYDGEMSSYNGPYIYSGRYYGEVEIIYFDHVKNDVRWGIDQMSNVFYED